MLKKLTINQNLIVMTLPYIFPHFNFQQVFCTCILNNFELMYLYSYFKYFFVGYLYLKYFIQHYMYKIKHIFPQPTCKGVMYKGRPHQGGFRPNADKGEGRFRWKQTSAFTHVVIWFKEWASALTAACISNRAGAGQTHVTDTSCTTVPALRHQRWDCRWVRWCSPSVALADGRRMK